MLKLNTPAAQPFWLEILPAVSGVPATGNTPATDSVPAQRTQFKPIDMPMILAARQAAAKAVLDTLPDGEKLEDLKTQDALHFAQVQAASNHAFTVALAQLGIVAWEGVGDDQGSPVLPTPNNIAAYLSNWRVFDAVDRQYVNPILVSSTEKNG